MCHLYMWHDSFMTSMICDMTHTRHNLFVDSFIYVTWLICLIYMCDMTHMSHLYMWHESYVSFIYVTWLICLIYICDMTHMWRESYVTWFIRDTTYGWLLYVWNMTHMSHLNMWHDSYMTSMICDITHTRHNLFVDSFICDMTHMSHLYVTWLICVIYICDLTHIWRESYVTWPIRDTTYALTPLYMRHDSYVSFIYVTWLIYDVNHMWHDSYVTQLIRSLWYLVATISRLPKMIGLFCKRALQKRRYSAKEIYNFKEPTDHSHPIISC